MKLVSCLRLSLLRRNNPFAPEHIDAGDDDDRHADQGQIIRPLVKNEKSQNDRPDQR